MKTFCLLTVIATLSLFPAEADVVITGTAETGTVTELPGSGTDFEFLGTPAPGEPGALTSAETAFTFSHLGNNEGYGSSLLNPLGQTIDTSVNYSFGSNFASGRTATGVAQITLGDSSTFNYSDFYVYVLYGNVGSDNFNDNAITLTPNDYSGDTTDSFATIGGGSVAVTEDSDASDGDTGEIVAFHVKGAASGQTLSLLVSADQFGELGAVSIAQTAGDVPEPQTWSLLVLGGAVGALGWRRFKRTA